MPLLHLLSSSDWDFPFFKKLPKNDTGSAPGHQGGIVVPKDLRKFFPTLVGTISAQSPTIDHVIKALLVKDRHAPHLVNTRYQIQTWGGTRDPESRITGNLAFLRDDATADDYIIFQRNIDDLTLYRLILIRKDSPEYTLMASLAKGRRWGELKDAPMTQDDFEWAVQQLPTTEPAKLNLFETDIDRTLTHGRKIARSIVFARDVKKLYQHKCAACGGGLTSPSDEYEVDAAHIVAKSAFGSDDPRNGIALCKTHHWAFDIGLFGVSNNRTIVVPVRVQKVMGNSSLANLHGKNIVEAVQYSLTASQEAFDWHFHNCVKQFM